MQSPQIQINMHQPNSWVYSELGIKALALVLRSGISVARPDPRVDAQLQVAPSGMYQGGSIKVIVVSSPSAERGMAYVNGDRLVCPEPAL